MVHISIKIQSKKKGQFRERGSPLGNEEPHLGGDSNLNILSQKLANPLLNVRGSSFPNRDPLFQFFPKHFTDKEESDP